jgi:O-Antigen ligase
VTPARAASAAGAVSPARAASAAALAVLLAGATALAFFSGGYFAGPRAVAGAVAWALVIAALFTARLTPPRTLGARLALGGLAGLAAWTLLSILWAPIAGNAYGQAQIAFLYLGSLVAATLLLRDPARRPLVEPALAAGVVIVIGYGLSERLLPGLLHFSHSVSAQGRLEQPLTYWNAMGELAALGFVLCARLAGAGTRVRALRLAAVAACAPLGAGVYVSFSRGALFACVAGLVALVVAARTREQLEATLLSLAAGVLAAAAISPLHGVTGLTGSHSTREMQGAIALAVLLVIALSAAALHSRLAARERVAGRAIRLPRHAGALATAVICAGLALAIVLGAKESSVAPLSGGAGRLVSLQSNRYAYWRVAFKAFAAEPLHGVGAGGWSVWWLRYRTVREFAQDAHSLPLQTLAELGVVGALLLLAFLGGLALAARTALRVDRAAVAGPIAALVVYVAHAPLDWDWQMPAVTLVAIVLAGLIIALGEAGYSSSAIRGASRLNSHTANTEIAT